MDRPITDVRNPFRQRPWLNGYGAADVSKGLTASLAGAISGGIDICVSYPPEYVKTQLQLDEKGVSQKYNGAIDCVTKTVNSRGILGLYKGLNVLIYASVPKSAIRFGSYEVFHECLMDTNGNLSHFGKLFAGLGAGTCEAIMIATPIETIRVKFIDDERSEHPKFKGFLHGVKLIAKEEGIRGLYQGLVPTILRQGSNQAVRFFVVGSLKELYKDGDKDKEVPTLLVGAFALISGVISVLANNPLDVVKTRMQGFNAAKYKNTLDCFWKILHNEGPLAFYKGMVPRLIRISLSATVSFMVYDSLMDMFDKLHFY